MHRIDPRIVIIQIALSGICAFWIFKPLAMLCEVIFLMSFLLYLQHPKEALRLGVWFAFLVGLYALLNESNAPQIMEKIGSIGVDAGLAGFFHNKPDYSDEAWSKFCDRIRHGDAWLTEDGFYSSSGYGDLHRYGGGVGVVPEAGGW